MSEKPSTSNNPNYTARPRPLSPHLQVYNLPLTAVLSVMHRASIIAMYFGMFGLILILADFAFVEHCQCAAWLKGTETGKLITKIVLGGYALAASYWICATIRHILGDFGIGLSLKGADTLNIIVILGSLAMAASIIFYGVI